ncbi:hypothetical protein F5876DRAFT_64818 [Lentinula aff. lateritia]|uniref:Uncharacterized protein n=1 Tax=Lentinula aff. lateritia TaxID=2804960 RepID=A0ACC1U2Y2_9AGAR|nr:hypothetical protein F5876DRAFT_64818 [Lentinula aff. lateritia]
MSSMRPLNHRRRSQSAYDPLTTPTINRDSSWGGATKRAYLTSFGTPDITTFKRDIESWQSKRRRRDGSPSGTSSDEEGISNLARNVVGLSPKLPLLPSSSADFDIFPRKDSRQRHSMYSTTTSSVLDPSIHAQSTSSSSSSYSDLARIRSNAFWELRRSVAENGEGFVRRMRDYEHSRARSGAFSKVKDAQKRGRKRSTLLARRSQTLRRDPDSEEEDDVQIFSGNLSDAFLSQEISSPSMSRSPRQSSLNDMDEDPRDPIQRPERSPSSSSSSYHIFESSSNSPYVFSSDMAQIASPPYTQLEVTPSSLNSASSSSSTSSISFQLPSAPSANLHPTGGISSSSSASAYVSASRSEKALAALSLAMANGAGSITEDYEALRALQPILTMDDAQIGEMWH